MKGVLAWFFMGCVLAGSLPSCGVIQPTMAPKLQSWEGEAREVSLLSRKHPVNEQSVPAAFNSRIVVDDGKAWRYQLAAIAFKFSQATSGLLGIASNDHGSLVILVDHRRQPLPPDTYRNRRIRATGRLSFASALHPIDGSALYPKPDPPNPLYVTTWVIETAPNQIEDLGLTH